MIGEPLQTDMRISKIIFLFGFIPLEALLPLNNFHLNSLDNDSNHYENILNSETNSFALDANLSKTSLEKGTRYPLIPKDVTELVALIINIESTIIDPKTSPDSMPSLGHYQQVLYRYLSLNPIISKEIEELLPQKYKSILLRHLSARKQFLELSKKYIKSNMLPAWEIINPETPEDLYSFYLKAQAATGIDWEVLAAINLVETGMGRIKGFSVANARGPMQFLSTTWELPGVGNGGDIDDPHDSIQAAARYLVIRGGLEDIRKGLWGYNNSDYYGKAVMEYVSLLKDNPRYFYAFYHWEIHVNTPLGDIWLPVGYSQETPIPISTYLKNYPVSAPPDYSAINSIKPNEWPKN